MTKRLVIIFGLVGFLISLICVKPVLVKAQQYCNCVKETDPTSGNMYCKKDSNMVESEQNLFWCPPNTAGSGRVGPCLDYKCQKITNGWGNEINDKCVCDHNGTIINGKMGCNFNPITLIGPETFPTCEAGICVCLSQEEIDGRNEAEKQRSAIEKKDKVDPFCAGFGPTSAKPMISTGLGCISVNFIDFVAWIFEKGSGIVGGIAFILLIGAFIQLATSEGDVKKIQGAKELITSTVTGLLLAIFSIFIIRLLMITILRLPGLK